MTVSNDTRVRIHVKIMSVFATANKGILDFLLLFLFLVLRSVIVLV